MEHKAIIDEYLAKEERARRIWRISSSVDKGRVQCSQFGVIPKKGKPGKWRLIVNLSAPDGRSVNDGIDKELASVQYLYVDDVVRRVLQLGGGVEIAKADVSMAYRNVPVHPRDRWLLGMEMCLLTAHCHLAYDQRRCCSQHLVMPSSGLLRIEALDG